MKRLFVFFLLACLLCGCDRAAPVPSESSPQLAETNPTSVPSPTDAPAETTEAVTQPPVETSAATEAPTEEVPTEEIPETVTVYLLEKSVLYDSGFTTYHYDENYNIDSYQVFNIENDPMLTAWFEEKDAGGMAGRFRIQWDAESSEVRTLEHFADGKLKEERYAGDLFCGNRYEYDLKGDVIQKQEFYEGDPVSTVYYEYTGELLSKVCCLDGDGQKVFECRIENGVITEKICYAYDGSYDCSYYYEYDERGNLVSMNALLEEGIMPLELYYYTAVEVDADRAWYLQEQQKYLIPIP